MFGGKGNSFQLYKERKSLFQNELVEMSLDQVHRELKISKAINRIPRQIPY